ncbi:MAG: ribbon-helix-helix protein, CopG family [Actinobacteria bacterium]|nr:ribbon-helix-helix protein, CopG family [Actinomycetota bacterium]
MRTTVTLDPDTEALVKELMQREGLSFKEAVNRAIRAGLTPAAGRRARFRQRSFAMGERAGIDYDRALQLAGRLEDDEIARKAALGK